MRSAPFIQKTSFTRRLRRILIIIAAFFLFGVASGYFTNQGFLTGLQSINNANNVLNLASNALESVNTADHNLEKLNTSTNVKLIQFSMQESVRLARGQIDEAMKQATPFTQVIPMLRQARSSLDDYEKTAIATLEKIEAGAGLKDEAVKGDVLIAMEFSSDVKESLRQAQINLKERTDSIFNGIYQNRFIPLIIASILSLMFFAFVVIVGLSSAKRLGQSLGNLVQATSAVAEGDLTYQAPISQPDEFGKLTHDFNEMVQSLRSNRHQLNVSLDRISRLQQITAALSEALLPEEVFEVIFEQAFSALKVNTGAVGLLDVENNRIVLQRIKGYDEEAIAPFKYISMDAVVPLVDAVKLSRPIFVETLNDIRKQYPAVLEVLEKSNVSATAAMPLIVEGKAIGAVVFNFSEDKYFDSNQKEFLKALISQCSQALHRSQLFEAARDAIQMRDEFLSIASHELRTPLTPLKLQIQKLGREVRKGNIQSMPPEQLLKTVDSSDRQVNRLANLIDDLLDVSRISSGKLTLNKEKLSLNDMVDEVVSHYGHQMRETNCDITVEAEPGLEGYFDKVRIEQVFINLLTNAAKYAPKKPITVTLKRSGDHACLLVRDQGPGIQPKDQKRIFDRFERVRDRDNVGGLGLGLYISRQIVDAHHGNIKVESEMGKGSTFIVELPLMENDHESQNSVS